jgi:hypothetical protein
MLAGIFLGGGRRLFVVGYAFRWLFISQYAVNNLPWISGSKRGTLMPG